MASSQISLFAGAELNSPTRCVPGAAGWRWVVSSLLWDHFWRHLTALLNNLADIS